MIELCKGEIEQVTGGSALLLLAPPAVIIAVAEYLKELTKEAEAARAAITPLLR